MKRDVKRRSRRRSLRGGMMREESAIAGLQRVANEHQRQESAIETMREYYNDLAQLARPLRPTLVHAYEVTAEEQNCVNQLGICEDELGQNQLNVGSCEEKLRNAKAELGKKLEALEQKVGEVKKLRAELEKRPELKKRDSSPHSKDGRRPWR